MTAYDLAAPPLTGRRWTCADWHGAPLPLYASREEARLARRELPSARRWAAAGSELAPRLCVLCDGWHLLPVVP